MDENEKPRERERKVAGIDLWGSRGGRRCFP